jgi:hypothetical protein
VIVQVRCVCACVSAWRYENVVDIAQYKYRILLLLLSIPLGSI